MYNSRRSVTVLSRGYSILVQLRQVHFREIMRKSPQMQSDFVNNAAKYTDVNKAHINEACKRWNLY